MTKDPLTQSTRIFRALLATRLISLLGTSITFFGLVFWLYMTTRSVTMLAIAYFCITVPGLIMLAPARAITQRLGPQKAMLVGNGGALLALFILLLPLLGGQLRPWHVYLMIVIRVTCIALDWPAYIEAVRVLVPKEQIERANRGMALADALPDIVGALPAGLLLPAIGLRGIVIINIVTFLCYLAFILLTNLPRSASSANLAAPQPSSLHEIRQGWQYIRSQPGLLALLLFFSATNFSMGMVLILIIPLGLSIASTAQFGLTLSLACFGPLLGTLIAGWWRTSSGLVYRILGLSLVQGLLLVLGSLRSSLWVIGGAAFMFLACFPLIIGASQAIWERKVPAEQHKQALTVRRTIAWLAMPVAEVLVGPLSDGLTVPLMAPGGWLAGNLGQLIGVGSGRGIAVVFIALGVLMLLAVIAGYVYPRLRRIEEEMPDVMSSETVIEAQLGVVNAF